MIAVPDIPRIVRLARTDVRMAMRRVLQGAGAIFLVLLIFFLLLGAGAAHPEFHDDFFRVVLFLAGIWLVQNAFADVHDGRRAPLFLTLPASVTEKFLTRWILTLPAFVAVTMFLYFAFSAFGALIGALAFETPIGLFNPFREEVWHWVRAFCLVHAVFMLGAVTFESGAFVKTVIVCALALLVMGTLGAIIGFVLLRDVLGEASMLQLMAAARSMGELTGPVALGVRIFLWVLAPYLWLVALVRLKESEAAGGES